MFTVSREAIALVAIQKKKIQQHHIQEDGVVTPPAPKKPRSTPHPKLTD